MAYVACKTRIATRMEVCELRGVCTCWTKPTSRGKETEDRVRTTPLSSSNGGPPFNVRSSPKGDREIPKAIELDLQDELLSDCAGGDTEGDGEKNTGDAGNVGGRTSEVIVKSPPSVAVAEESGFEATIRKICIKMCHLISRRRGWHG